MKWLVRAVLFAFFVALARTAILAPADGTDFQVYWNAAQHFWHGEKVYSFARDALRCFKYPPWILPWFLWLGPFSLGAGAVLFRLLSVGAILSLWRELRRSTSEWASVAVLLFWGFWMYNTQTGQISAFLLLAAVRGFESRRAVLLFSALSAKIVQLYSLLGVPWLRARDFVRAAVGFALLSVPSLWQYGFRIGEWFRDFKEACTSMGPDLSASNQGIAALWIALLHLPLNEIRSHYLAAVASAVLLATIYFVFKKNLLPKERFAVMLAYGGILHPLAFSYNLVWACPLAAHALSRAFQQKRRRVLTVFVLLELAVISDKLLPALTFPGYRAAAVVTLSWLMLVRVRKPVPGQA